MARCWDVAPAPSPPPRVALVTGASDGGIGCALCVQLLALNARHNRTLWVVYGACRRPEATMGVAAGLGARPLAFDVTDAAAVARAVARVEAEAGGIDLLVNNAGVGFLGPVLEVSAQSFVDCFATNVFGLVSVIQATAPGMARRRRGTIVNVASAIGALQLPYTQPYGASKAAVIALSDSLRMELSPFGVRVVTLCPGGVRTEFGRNSHTATSEQADSLYAPFRAAKAAREKDRDAEYASYLSADAFAKDVVAAITRNNPPPRMWGGFGTGLLRLALLLPQGVQDRALQRRAGL